MQTIDLHPQLILAHTDSTDGNMDERFNDRSVVMSNRRKFYNQFNLNPRLVIEGKQIHSDRILLLNAENTKMWVGMNIPGVDGFVTNQAEAGLLLKLADCVPVVVYDPTHHALGLFHAGWKGAVKNIHLKGLTMMQTAYQTNPSEVLVWLGPSAQKCCFTSAETPQQLEDSTWTQFIEPKDSGYAIDIPGYLAASFKLAGIKSKHLIQDSRCTVEDESLYSNARAKHTNLPQSRFLVLAKLR
jgi:YfiH family protein